MYGEKSLSVARQLQQIGSLYYLSGRKDVGVTYYEQAFNIFPDDSKRIRATSRLDIIHLRGTEQSAESIRIHEIGRSSQ